MDSIAKVRDILNEAERHGIQSRSTETLRLICNTDTFGEVTGIPQGKELRVQELMGQIQRELPQKSPEIFKHGDDNDENRDRIAKLNTAVNDLKQFIESRQERDQNESKLTSVAWAATKISHRMGRMINSAVNILFRSDYVDLAIQGNLERIPQEARQETLKQLETELQERLKQIK